MTPAEEGYVDPVVWRGTFFSFHVRLVDIGVSLQSARTKVPMGPPKVVSDLRP